jgi:hypothetical protein
MWVGISLDEFQRMKPSGLKWIENRWPLIEQRITRNDCLAWFAERYPGRRLAKSACVFCPYKRDRDWAEMRDNDPESFAAPWPPTRRCATRGRARAVRVELDGAAADGPTAEDLGQQTFDRFECEWRMCGV